MSSLLSRESSVEEKSTVVGTEVQRKAVKRKTRSGSGLDMVDEVSHHEHDHVGSDEEHDHDSKRQRVTRSRTARLACKLWHCNILRSDGE